MERESFGSSGQIIDCLHLVLDVEKDGLFLDFGSVVEDLIITSPQGDVLLSWTILPTEPFNDMACLLLQTKDNMKEFTDVNCTHLALKPVDSETIRVYVTVQNN